jgi:hypothetical protein
VTDAASRTAGRRIAAGLGFVAILLGGFLLASTGCGSVTSKKSDGGGTGGTVVDSSTKVDVVAANDMRMSDARSIDTSSRGGSSGAGGRGSGGAGSGGTGGGSGGTGSGGTGGGSGGTAGTGGGTGGGSGGTGGAGECTSNGDCTLYTGAGSGCCGVCQAASDPAPPPVECLLACLTPLKACGCVNNQCVGSKTQL